MNAPDAKPASDLNEADALGFALGGLFRQEMVQRGQNVSGAVWIIGTRARPETPEDHRQYAPYLARAAGQRPTGRGLHD